MSARADAARATVARLGIDVDAPDAARIAAALAGPDGVELAAALGEVGGEAVAALLAAPPADLPKPVRKAVRGACFRLRQRGVAVPATPPPAPPARAVGADLEGLVSAVDGRGERLVWLVKSPPSGATLVVAVELNEPDGIREVRVLDSTRKQLRATRERLEREAGLRIVPADWRALDALCVEGQARLATVERSRDYLRVRGRLTSEPPAPPVELRPALDVPADEAESLVADGMALLREPELRTWWPSLDAVAPFVDEVAAVRESPLVLAPAQQEERVRAVFQRAAETLFPPAVTARRLEATAFVLAASGRVPQARRALATADALRARSAMAEPPPLVQALVQQAIGAVYAERQAERERGREGALVLTPGEALTPRSPSRPARTPGGPR